MEIETRSGGEGVPQGLTVAVAIPCSPRKRAAASQAEKDFICHRYFLFWGHESQLCSGKNCSSLLILHFDF